MTLLAATRSAPIRQAAVRLLLASAVIAAADRSGAQQTLRWRFEAGESLRYAVVKTSVVKITTATGDTTTSTTEAMDVVWNVERVADDGSADLKVAIERVQMRLTGPGGQAFSLDTSTPAPAEGLAALIAPAFEQLVSDGFGVTVSPRGDLSSVTASPELMAALDALPAGLGDSPREILKQQVAPIAVPLPAGELSAGSRWKHNAVATLAVFGATGVQTTYAYQGQRQRRGRELAVLVPSISLKLSPPEGSEGAGPQGATLRAENGPGEVLFDIAAGRLVAASSAVRIDFRASPGGAPVAGQPITGRLDQSTRITLDEKCLPLDATRASGPGDQPRRDGGD